MKLVKGNSYVFVAQSGSVAATYLGEYVNGRDAMNREVPEGTPLAAFQDWKAGIKFTLVKENAEKHARFIHDGR
jgi:hypothetical protein